MNYIYHYNEIVHIQDLEILFLKNFYAFLVFEVLNINVYLDEIDYYKFSF